MIKETVCLLIFFISYSAFAESCPSKPSNFKEVDLRKDFGPVTDQDSVGYCYAHTSANMLNYYLKSQGALDTTKKENMVAPVALGAQHDKNYGLNLQREVVKRKISSMSEVQLQDEIKEIEAAKEAFLINGKKCATETLECAKKRSKVDYLNYQIKMAKSWLKKKSFPVEAEIGDDGGIGYVSFMDALEQGFCLEGEVNSLDYVIPQVFNEELNKSTIPAACEGLSSKIVKDAVNKHDMMKYVSNGSLNVLYPNKNSNGSSKLSESEIIDYFSIDMDGETMDDKIENAKDFYELLKKIRDCKPIEINPRGLLQTLSKVLQSKKLDELQCKDLLQVQKALPGSELADVKDLLKRFQAEGDGFFNNAFQDYCKTSVPKVPKPKILSKNYNKSSDEDVIAELDKALDQNKPVAIGYTMQVFERPIEREELRVIRLLFDPGHGSTIIGKVYNCEREGEFYILRNSYGKNSCSVFKNIYPFVDEKGNAPFYCDDEGNFLVEKKHMAKSIFRSWTYE